MTTLSKCFSTAFLSAFVFAGCAGGATVGAGLGPAPVSVSASATPSPVPVVEPSTGKGGGASSEPSLAPVTPSPTPLGATPAPSPPPAAALPAGKYIYVVNRGTFGAGNDASSTVTVYPVTASGNATPIATLGGPATGLEASMFVAVDPSGKVYVANENRGFRTGSITEYTNVYGNNSPVTTLSGLFSPGGLALDAAGDLISTQIDGMYVYPPGATSGSAFTFIHGGINDDIIYNPYEVFVNKNNKIYLALQNQIEVYAPSPTPASTPLQNIFGTASQTYYILGAAADSTDTVYATNGPLNNVIEFSSTADNGDGSSTTAAAGPAPSGVVASTSFNDPWGIFVDSSDNVYVVNHGNNSILYFASGSFATGIPTATISGANTGLNGPTGIYVR